MQVTFDSTEPLTTVLPVINAVYNVSLSVGQTSSDDQGETPGATRTRSSRGRSTKSGGARSTSRRSKRQTATTGEMREWARANGLQVSSRGRISREITEAYLAAT